MRMEAEISSRFRRGGVGTDFRHENLMLILPCPYVGRSNDQDLEASGRTQSETRDGASLLADKQGQLKTFAPESLAIAIEKDIARWLF
jgi:hypothetical protein